MKSIFKVVIISILLCTVGAALYAEQQTAAKSVAPKYSEVKYSADTYSYRWDGGDKILVLTGNVKFVQGDTTILADKVDYHEATRIAVATGNLKIFDPQNTIVGKQCTVSFKDKKATISGAVHINVKPKPSASTDSKAKKEWKDEVIVTCESVDYLYKDKKAVIPTAVTIVQKTRTVTADSATYSGKDEIVELVGNAKGLDEKDKHTFSAPKVRISLKDGSEWVEAEKASGTLYIKDEDEEKPETSEKTPEKK